MVISTKWDAVQIVTLLILSICPLVCLFVKYWNLDNILRQGINTVHALIISRKDNATISLSASVFPRYDCYAYVDCHNRACLICL